ncbi:MAG TPA: TAT-variant-translocated molybdopterin oxidoreductase [Methylomirabilota bacterium]|nr:TAT-variant-translocated molybdopterin oxidoreductase [Methylomirabilota bacterium]
MKTIPPPCPEPEVGPKYWRSLEQLADKPEFKEWAQREFQPGASELTDPVTRRSFMKLMSASLALAGIGAAGCRRPVHTIVPHTRLPEGYVHGVAKFYATSMPTQLGAMPLVVKSHEGRPIKVEGNGQHPDSNGGTDAIAQASVLSLYDPDRASRYLNAGKPVGKDAALQELARISQTFTGNRGQGLAFLVERSSSPSLQRVQAALAQKMPQARWFAHEGVDFDIHRQAASAATGQSVRPHFHVEKASVIVSLDADILAGEEECHRYSAGFSKNRKLRKPTDSMNRLYVVESMLSVTGINADHRKPTSPSGIAQAALDLASAVVDKGQVADKWVAECANDLLKPENRGKVLVVAGQRQPIGVHLAAYAINQALGSIGQTVTFTETPAPREGTIAELTSHLQSGAIDTLVIVGSNPVYTAPTDLNFGSAIANAKNIVRLGYYEDETAQIATWHIPAAHYLESWGDALTYGGVYTPVQPLIAPIFGGLDCIEFLARIAGEQNPSSHDIVRETFRLTAQPQDVVNGWRKFLHDGFLDARLGKASAAQVSNGVLQQARSALANLPAASKDNLQVQFIRDYKVGDGFWNNNAWLQELPDPITKMTWENTILLGPTTAKALGLEVVDKENNQLFVPKVKISVNGKEIEGPIWVQPGHAENTIGLTLGYGRSRTGRVGKGTGYNAYALRTTQTATQAAGAKLQATGALHQLATTQNHWSMEGRPIVREANLDQYKAHPQFAKGMNMHQPEAPDALKGKVPDDWRAYENPLEKVKERALHQWGMVIDLNACTGCSACVIACQSENNIPVVGKQQVARNREMHWIRIDRYYAGTPENPQTVTQPMLCQHCEKAPCENVCPVNATVHDHEGLNVMVYNRCVGTRYCSNNCAWKVRRFNYFDYNKRPITDLYKGPLAKRPQDEVDLVRLVSNPDVTVRMRGVMEKCTFCVQRIEAAKIAQKVKAKASGDVVVPDGTFTVACAQACPSDAITFGNLADEKSEVSQLKQVDRNYTVLEFLATQPRLTYLARVRNQNPAMPDYTKHPFTTQAYMDRSHSDPFSAGHDAHDSKTGGTHSPGEQKGGHH